MRRPNVLFVMTDQQRFDTIAALGNEHIVTPNLDRLVRRGVAFTNAYSTCPVCMPARYTIRTGCEPTRTGSYGNRPVEGMHARIEENCGPYLAATMSRHGYRTFGVGKFHTFPWDAAVGYDVQLHSEELYYSPDQRARDAYASFIAHEHPEYDFLETLMGERTEMYYVPQMSPLPAELGVEAWAADRAVDLIGADDGRPYFGFVSFIGPHPPLAPPLPFNRMYDPDRMPNPVVGDIAVDHMDEQIPAMNYAIWADDINDSWARICKARYYGEVTYIDQCLGRILDTVESGADADDTLICFFADHGEHLGDHHAWQKESFFEASTRVPFLLSWPGQVQAAQRSNSLLSLADLFGIATGAAGSTEVRDGVDVLGMLAAKIEPRERVLGYYGTPGGPGFKVMVREGNWKYIFMANGGREQLFDVAADPHELRQVLEDEPRVAKRMRTAAVDALRRAECLAAVDGDDLRSFDHVAFRRQRVHQFDWSRGVTSFPENPVDILRPLATPASARS